MKQYLLSIYQPDGPPPPTVDLARIMRDVTALRDAMKAAGVLVFSEGLHPADSATVIRVHQGKPVLSDGPYVESKEHMGGLVIIKVADLDAALDWGRRLATVLEPLSIEVRPIASGHRG